MTRKLGNDVSTSKARHSRVKFSMMLHVRIRCPVANAQDLTAILESDS
jgi:hypothetical protein